MIKFLSKGKELALTAILMLAAVLLMTSCDDEPDTRGPRFYFINSDITFEVSDIQGNPVQDATFVSEVVIKYDNRTEIYNKDNPSDTAGSKLPELISANEKGIYNFKGYIDFIWADEVNSVEMTMECIPPAGSNLESQTVTFDLTQVLPAKKPSKGGHYDYDFNPSPSIVLKPLAQPEK